MPGGKIRVSSTEQPKKRNGDCNKSDGTDLVRELSQKDLFVPKFICESSRGTFLNTSCVNRQIKKEELENSEKLPSRVCI